MCVGNVINELLLGYHWSADNCAKFVYLSETIDRVLHDFCRRRSVMLVHSFPWFVRIIASDICRASVIHVLRARSASTLACILKGREQILHACKILHRVRQNISCVLVNRSRQNAHFCERAKSVLALTFGQGLLHVGPYPVAAPLEGGT